MTLTTHNPYFNVTPIFDAEYLSIGLTVQEKKNNQELVYALLNSANSNDLEWVLT